LTFTSKLLNSEYLSSKFLKMGTISLFNGPIQDLPISEWLSGCEDAFESYEEDNEKTMTDKQKIHAAGNSISKASPTDKLYSWWIENRKKLEAKK